MLPARAFYSIIVAGVLLGLLAGAGGAWAFLQSQPPQPDRPRELMIPIAAMIAATFGGIAGVAAAVRLDLRQRGFRSQESGVREQNRNLGGEHSGVRTLNSES